MLSAYPACFYEEYEGGYSVLFPDFNYAGTQGDTLEDAFSMAIDFLAGMLYDMKLDNEPYPAPSQIKDVDPNNGYDEYKNVLVNIVTVDVEEYARIHFEKPVKKTLSIPKWLNDTAMDRGINFSQTLQEALLLKIKSA